MATVIVDWIAILFSTVIQLDDAMAGCTH